MKTYCPLCGFDAAKIDDVPIENYRWKTVGAIDLPFWAAKQEGWRVFKVVEFMGKEQAILYREKILG